MTDNAQHQGSDHSSPKHYVKVWLILLVLFVISYEGPNMAPKLHEAIGINPKFVVLATAFGIAIVKAYMVIKNFMHLNLEKRYVSYIVATMLLLMVTFFSGVAPDVLRHDGQNWINESARQEILRGKAAAAQEEAHHESEPKNVTHDAPTEH